MLLAVFVFNGYSQNLKTTAVKQITLAMQGDYGTNGCAVTYNTQQQIYYACFAGNTSYPLETFNLSGDHLSETTTGYDARGLWYSPKRKRLEGNSYDGTGLYFKNLDSKGLPTGEPILTKSSIVMPMSQSIGAYDEKKDRVVCYDGGKIYFYKAKNFKSKGTLTLNSSSGFSFFTQYASIWTGIKGYEIGLFDFYNNKLYLFNAKSGNIAASVSIPLDYEHQGFFNISYCNNTFWTFDIDSREWTGWKIWE